MRSCVYVWNWFDLGFRSYGTSFTLTFTLTLTLTVTDIYLYIYLYIIISTQHHITTSHIPHPTSPIPHPMESFTFSSDDERLVATQLLAFLQSFSPIKAEKPRQRPTFQLPHHKERVTVEAFGHYVLVEHLPEFQSFFFHPSTQRGAFRALCELFPIMDRNWTRGHGIDQASVRAICQEQDLLKPHLQSFATFSAFKSIVIKWDRLRQALSHPVHEGLPGLADTGNHVAVMAMFRKAFAAMDDTDQQMVRLVYQECLTDAYLCSYTKEVEHRVLRFLKRFARFPAKVRRRIGMHMGDRCQAELWTTQEYQTRSVKPINERRLHKNCVVVSPQQLRTLFAAC